ncbi:MAG: hypothetical protein HY278_05305 [candidate division NC10 bacterium]|nr:hypothetical protein [candidate division NC10 bacterium]
MNPLIPSPDPIPLPAPAWLLEGLLVFTLFLHLLPMSLLMGGGSLTVISEFLGRRDDRHRRLAQATARLLPVVVAFTITLGIAPLLFLQVVFGPLFFSSSILMAWPWLSIVGMMLVGYYGYYWHSFQFERLGRRAVWVTLASAALFIIIGLLFTSNMVLMLTPARWGALYKAGRSGMQLGLAEPTVLPRFLHMFVASLALSGLGIAILGAVKARADTAFGTWVRQYGLRWFVAATWLQFAVGFWFLASLPASIRSLFLGGGTVETGLLIVALSLAVISLLTIQRWLAFGTTAILGTVALMVVIRDRLRAAYLASEFDPAKLAIQPQMAIFALFVLILLCGIAAIAWMVWKFALANVPRTQQ